ncbi:hypothetical protein QTG54_009393 [Skeletonema marinoi]|uniref:Uncharacterized protein n=1 Tax=Skeletonema marinoi TaxID=267567 RepID=A0AAD9DB98_9STRA|nr:hypothetical protein QTG54_009393 [Skeletonema marinoi]
MVKLHQPPKCTKVQSISGEIRSQWILPGEPLPPHWAAHFNTTNCDAGPAGIGYNCNIGDVTGVGYYYTGGSALLVFRVQSDAKDTGIATTKGWLLSDTCSKLRRDDPPVQEFLVFDTVTMTYLLGNTGVSLYTLNEEESEGCKGYMISFGIIITGYGGGEQFTEATPFRDQFNSTIGCTFDTCRYTGEICKYEEVDGEDGSTTATTITEGTADTANEGEEVATAATDGEATEPSPAGSRHLKKMARLANFVLHMVGF